MTAKPISIDNAEDSVKPRRFRLWLYLLIIFGLSWIFLLPSALINFRVEGGGSPWSQLILGSIGMLMVTVSTFIAGRWVFRDGFNSIGWRWGSASSWALALGLPLLIFLVPAALDILMGSRTLAPFKWNNVMLTLFVIFFGPILGFGEEFGFRGYLLPRLWWMGARKALIVSGVIYWAWHWPVWLIPFVLSSLTSAAQLNLPTEVVLMQSLPTILIGLLTTSCTAFILSYIWMRSKSIVVASVFHGYFDAARNITMFYLFVGISPLASSYYLIFIVVLGLLLLWRARWILPEPLQLCALPVPKNKFAQRE